MKKNSKTVQSPQGASARRSITIGMDLGDRTSRYCVLEGGEVVREASVASSKQGLTQAFGREPGYRIAIEAGTHSPWVSRLLRELGHEVIVANPRRVRMITHSSNKSDRMDAKTLARLARIDPELLRPVQHRSEKAQMDLMRIRVRAGLVEARTALVNALRGLAKSVGERLPACDADGWDLERLAGLPAPLQDVLQPLVQQVQSLTQQIEQLQQDLEQIARTEYPETKRMQQVHGVGTLIALTFCLTLDDPRRFPKSRDVGCYTGLRPRRSQSGQSDPQLRITKEGDVYLRKMLVQGAHRVLSRQAPDTDLRRWGWRLAARGGKNAKKRAVVAVARKLGILLHRLWVTGEVYQPLRHPPVPGQAAA